MKPIFRTDTALIFLGAGSLISGILIHYAGHFKSHDVWHNWSVVHIVINIALVILVAVHIKQHKGWFRQLFKKTSLKKKMAIFVTIGFGAVTISGIYLLAFADGQGTHPGLWHYWMGMIFGVLAVLHLLKRWNIFRKGALLPSNNK